MKRRDFFKTSMVASVALLGSSSELLAGTTHKPIDNRKSSGVAFPEKKPMITYSNRPPLLESLRSTFTRGITENDEFFVRWHLPDIPTHLDDSFKIKVGGLVKKELNLTVKDLKNNFKPVEVTAVVQCGGNSRSAFDPMPGGIQWGSGATGCAKWKGVRLIDVLKRAGLQNGAEWITFNGAEKPAYDKTPDFVRELELSEIKDNVIIAYEMNGEDLPYLNGFPVRLIVPGYYSDSWVKMLSEITVYDKYKHLFFMDKGYRIADNATESEDPKNLAKKTKPITFMNVKSIIGYPDNDMVLRKNSHIVVRGVAWDGGSGIAKVLISTDGGKTWDEAKLKNKNGNFAYTEFRYAYKPTKTGELTFMAKAINNKGEEQPFAEDIKWNRGGYKYNGIDSVKVKVI